MKKLLCLAVCLSALACTACAKNKSFGSRLYDAAVKGTATVKKTVNKVRESESYAALKKELEETLEKAKKEWEQTGSKEAKKKYEAAKAALEKFTKDVESAEKEAE